MQQKITYYTTRNFQQIPQIKQLPEETIKTINVVSHVLPFRVNNYVIDHLINWDNIPEDPIFQLTFPQQGMLETVHFNEIYDLLYKKTADKQQLQSAIFRIRQTLNPHPSKQKELNVPMLNGKVIEGIQHKYQETTLFFPAQGQTCHSYCTFCFRWAQFIGDNDLKFKSSSAEQLKHYLLANPQVTDVIFTGGDPMIAKTRHLKSYLQVLLDPKLDHIQNIRIGSKALTYWPYRFLTDEDATELLDLFQEIVNRGKHLAFMAHFNHYHEFLDPKTDQAIPALQTAVQKILATGAIIRSQAPVLNHINNDPDVWVKMWKAQTRLGIIPYYMFVERDTGAKNYFEIPLSNAYDIYRNAIKQLSGLSRTVRGPVMSATPGKVEILGTTNICDEDVFVARFLQGRNPEWTYKPFFIKYDAKATWWDQLQPAFGKDKFFFEETKSP